MCPRKPLIIWLAGLSLATLSLFPAFGNELYDSAVVYYPFETLGAGGEVNDSNAHSVNLVASGGAANLVSGVNGNGIYLPDGVVLTTTATGSDDSVLNVTRDTPFSIASWVKLENSGDRFYLASKYRRDVGGPLELRGWSFAINTGGILEGIWRLDQQLGTSGRISARSNAGFTDTQWHHVAMTFGYDEADATRGIRMYIDGVPQEMTAVDTGLAGESDIDLSHDWPFVVSGRYDTQLNEGGSADDLAIWNTVLTPQQIASLVPASHPGDFNGDGIVDAADYTVWRDGLGTTYLPADYDTWKTYFGTVAGTASAAATHAAVPEPTSLMLTACAALLSMLCGRRT